jgi:hypothetical protein
MSRFRRYALATTVCAIFAVACRDVATAPKHADRDLSTTFLSLSTDSFAVLDAELSLATPTTANDSTSLVSLIPIVCPNGTEHYVQGTIGILGGSIGTAGVVLTLPPGAVTTPTVFEVRVPVGEHLEAEIHAVGQESFRFAVPAKIAISTGRCGKLPDDLRAVYWRDGLLLENMGRGQDREHSRIVFFTPHLSGYVIATGRAEGDTTGTAP